MLTIQGKGLLLKLLLTNLITFINWSTPDIEV